MSYSLPPKMSMIARYSLTIAILSFLYLFAISHGQDLNLGTDGRGSGNSRPPVVCNPQNYIQVDVPKCPANETILGIVTKLDSLEQSLNDLGQTFQDPNKVSQTLLHDCYDVLQAGYSSNGSYTIQTDPKSEPFDVFCDMETESGGWTVFQRRMDGRLDFFRDWQSYKSGFGHVNAEFWLGNDKLFRLTNQRLYQLRVDMADFEGNSVYALYGYFVTSDEYSGYKVLVGDYSGTAGDSLSYHSNSLFSTRDRDNDKSVVGDEHCAVRYSGAWWYNGCHNSNLNGLYLNGPHESNANGVNWGAFKGNRYSLKRTEMKIRPVV
ncbi:microfibril-associated glycoprotein 4-like [Glandiceps talaboti]